MVQFLSIIFFLGFLQFLLDFSKVPVFLCHSVYVYFKSLHVSNSRMLIIRRVNCINKISVICHSMQVTVRYAGLDVPSKAAYQTVTYIRRVTYNRYLIDAIDSPDDEHMAVRIMQRFEINIYKNMNCASSWLFKKNHITYSLSTQCCAYPIFF